jgi:hypothetical protein
VSPPQPQPVRPVIRPRRLGDGLRRAAAPTAIWLVAVLLARVVGFELTIPWSHFQILDRPFLEARPMASLRLLHQQPPLFNALLAACLRAASWLGTTPELVLKGVYLGVGLGMVLLFTGVVERVTGSRRLALVGAAAMVADPAFHYYGNLGWYPFLVRAEVVLFAWAAVRALEEGRRAHLGLALGALVVLNLTRSLFHPLWSIGAAALLFFLVLRRHPGAGPAASARRLAPLAAGFLVLLALWPLKNLVVFDRFVYSSITGINLVRITTADQSEWLAFFNRGQYGPEVAAHIEDFRRRYGDELLPLVAAPEKFDGSRNWNHLTTLHVGPELTRRASAWRRENPRQWALIIAMQYFHWARPAFIQSYTGRPRGPANAAYEGYAQAWQALFFTDVRPLVEPATPGLAPLHGIAILRRDGSPLRYSLFGLLWFPLVVGLAAASLLWRGQRRSVAGGAILLSLYAVGWTLCVPIMTDGIEANRMRYSTSALFTLLLLERLGALLRRRAGRARSSG